MRKTIFTVLIFAAGAVRADPLACMIEPDKVAEIGAPGIGIIEEIKVQRGDRVKAGQVLAYMKADVERASVSVASARARADADLKAALAARELAEAKVERARDLVGVGFISQEALDQAEAESRIARFQVDQAQEARRIAQQELALSNSQLARRTVRSPFPGLVVDRYRTEGERIEREPIVRIAKVDPLRVEVVLPLSYFGHIQEEAPVNIRTGIEGMENLVATVTLVDRMVDAASNTFRVRLTLPNPEYRIPAGLRCKADFGIAPRLSRNDVRVATPTAAMGHQVIHAGMVRADAGKLSYELSTPKRQ